MRNFVKKEEKKSKKKGFFKKFKIKARENYLWVFAKGALGGGGGDVPPNITTENI
jgi:hypothetical protein